MCSAVSPAYTWWSIPSRKYASAHCREAPTARRAVASSGAPASSSDTDAWSARAIARTKAINAISISTFVKSSDEPVAAHATEDQPRGDRRPGAIEVHTVALAHDTP